MYDLVERMNKCETTADGVELLKEYIKQAKPEEYTPLGVLSNYCAGYNLGLKQYSKNLLKENKEL